MALAMAMATTTTTAKVLRGARPGSSSELLVPAIFRRVAREGAAQGPSPAAPAAGVGRLMHTGAKLPFGRQVLSQQRKIVRTEQSSSSRSYTGGHGDLVPLHFSALAVVCALALGVAIPNSNILKRIKKKYTKEE